jgi:hypothetical protein
VEVGSRGDLANALAEAVAGTQPVSALREQTGRGAACLP